MINASSSWHKPSLASHSQMFVQWPQKRQTFKYLPTAIGSFSSCSWILLFSSTSWRRKGKWACGMGADILLFDCNSLSAYWKFGFCWISIFMVWWDWRSSFPSLKTPHASLLPLLLHRSQRSMQPSNFTRTHAFRRRHLIPPWRSHALKKNSSFACSCPSMIKSLKMFGFTTQHVLFCL